MPLGIPELMLFPHDCKTDFPLSCNIKRNLYSVMSVMRRTRKGKYMQTTLQIRIGREQFTVWHVNGFQNRRVSSTWGGVGSKERKKVYFVHPMHSAG
ncbi:hypothetical protein CEXT_551921 [Caerostris extrusa]|uniref:Uncharacterized protein n=1 Tax=Caerostris extrusa TaxID=172846 RepID=A0AAV4U112_CAEEX|nr:hypothetical protein CEXT_551921 [Caerostris extrusa]